jgi:hypothetical protein
VKGILAVALALLVAAAALMTSGPEDRQRCNAAGDVRYIGDRKYVCEKTALNGLRWTWKW